MRKQLKPEKPLGDLQDYLCNNEMLLLVSYYDLYIQWWPLPLVEGVGGSGTPHESQAFKWQVQSLTVSVSRSAPSRTCPPSLVFLMRCHSTMTIARTRSLKVLKVPIISKSDQNSRLEVSRPIWRFTD